MAIFKTENNSFTSAMLHELCNMLKLTVSLKYEGDMISVSGNEKEVERLKESFEFNKAYYGFGKKIHVIKI